MSERKKNKTRIKKLGVKNSFIVPDGYFENFSSRLQSRLQKEKDSQHARYGIYLISKYKLALAASFIGIIIITYSGIKYFSRLKTPAIEIADIINYQINDFDDTMIFDLYEESSIEDSDQGDVSDERILNEMIEYLVISNVDLQLIPQDF